MTEEWRDIPGFEGRYQASNLGQVRSYAKVNPKILRQEFHYRGYKRVMLCKQPGHRRHFFVHRLVAETFILNEERLPVVNHKDRDKWHNAVVNLEWVTFSQNTVHYHETPHPVAF